MTHKVVFNNCYGGFSISLKAVDWLETNCKDNELYDLIKSLRLAEKKYSFLSKDECICYDISDWLNDKRHHKDLVAVVEALGNDVNGHNAALEVCKIDDNLYRIDKYDGAESAITPYTSGSWVIIE
jgi:hypothetical protein